MSYPCHIALVLHDRDAIDRLVDALIAGRGPEWSALARRLPPAPGDGGRRVHCVQRQARFLGDHTIEENWQLPLWERAADDLAEWEWLLAQGRALFARYSGAAVNAYPAQLDELSLLAAQFVQAHIMMPEILLLDAVLSGWHRTDLATVGRMIRDYADRHPLRALLYVDVAEPPPGILPFRVLEGEPA